MMIFVVTLCALSIAGILVLVRMFLGPTVYDRLLGVNALGTIAIIVICTINFLTGRPEFLDLALIYAVLNFIGTIAIDKFVKDEHFVNEQDTHERGDI